LYHSDNRCEIATIPGSKDQSKKQLLAARYELSWWCILFFALHDKMLGIKPRWSIGSAMDQFGKWFCFKIKVSL